MSPFVILWEFGHDNGKGAQGLHFNLFILVNGYPLMTAPDVRGSAFRLGWIRIVWFPYKSSQ